MSEDNYPFIAVVNGATGEEGVMTICVNVAVCGSPPFLSDADYTPSVRVDNRRRPLCEPCARELVRLGHEQHKPVPDFDWERAYPRLDELLREEP